MVGAAEATAAWQQRAGRCWAMCDAKKAWPATISSMLSASFYARIMDVTASTDGEFRERGTRPVHRTSLWGSSDLHDVLSLVPTPNKDAMAALCQFEGEPPVPGLTVQIAVPWCTAPHTVHRTGHMRTVVLEFMSVVPRASAARSVIFFCRLSRFNTEVRILVHLYGDKSWFTPRITPRRVPTIAPLCRRRPAVKLAALVR